MPQLFSCSYASGGKLSPGPNHWMPKEASGGFCGGILKTKSQMNPFWYQNPRNSSARRAGKQIKSGFVTNRTSMNHQPSSLQQGSRKRSPVFTVCCPSSYVVSVHQPYREVPWTTSANGLTAEMVMYWIPRHLKRPYSLRAAHSELWLYLVLVNHVAQNGSHSESFYSNNKAF